MPLISLGRLSIPKVLISSRGALIRVFCALKRGLNTASNGRTETAVRSETQFRQVVGVEAVSDARRARIQAQSGVRTALLVPTMHYGSTHLFKSCTGRSPLTTAICHTRGPRYCSRPSPTPAHHFRHASTAARTTARSHAARHFALYCAWRRHSAPAHYRPSTIMAQRYAIVATRLTTAARARRTAARNPRIALCAKTARRTTTARRATTVDAAAPSARTAARDRRRSVTLQAAARLSICAP